MLYRNSFSLLSHSCLLLEIFFLTLPISTVDILTLQVHLYVDFFSPLRHVHTINVFSLPYDLLNNIFFSLIYKNKNTTYDIYNIKKC